MRSGLKRMEDNINFLSSVPLFQNLNKDHLTKIADALEVVSTVWERWGWRGAGMCVCDWDVVCWCVRVFVVYMGEEEKE